MRDITPNELRQCIKVENPYGVVSRLKEKGFPIHSKPIYYAALVDGVHGNSRFYRVGPRFRLMAYLSMMEYAENDASINKADLMNQLASRSLF
jgi:hypothetical protein